MAAQCQLSVAQLGPLAGDYVQESDGVEGVLPMHDEKWRRLLVQEEVLAQEAPEGKRFATRSRLVRGIRVVAECLDIANRASLNVHQLFEGGTRIHAAIVIDGDDAFPEIHGQLRVGAGAEMV